MAIVMKGNHRPQWVSKTYQCYLKHKNTKYFENPLNPIMFVFIGKLMLSSNIRVPLCQGVSVSFHIILY